MSSRSAKRLQRNHLRTSLFPQSAIMLAHDTKILPRTIHSLVGPRTLSETGPENPVVQTKKQNRPLRFLNLAALWPDERSAPDPGFPSPKLRRARQPPGNPSTLHSG